MIKTDYYNLMKQRVREADKVKHCWNICGEGPQTLHDNKGGWA